jgi:hypothetical protein
MLRDASFFGGLAVMTLIDTLQNTLGDAYQVEHGLLEDTALASGKAA